MDSYYQYYCCSGLDDTTNSAATKKETLKLASKVLEKMADEFMVPATGQNDDDNDEAGAGGLTSPTSRQTPVRIAKMLGRGLDDYLEIALEDVQECVTAFSSHLMQNVKAQAKPIAWDFEDEESVVLYLDFMKSVDEAQYILKNGVHPTAEIALAGPFYRKAEQTLKLFHDRKKKISNEEQSKPAASQSRRGSTLPTATNSPSASRSETSNGRVAAPAAAESFMEAANDRNDHMATDAGAVAVEGEKLTKSDESAVCNTHPEIQVTDTFDAAVGKLKLAGWDEKMVPPPSSGRWKRVYVHPGTSDQFDKNELKKYLRETYGWSVKRKLGRSRKDTETQSTNADEKKKKTKKPKLRGAAKTTSASKKTKKETASGSSMTPKKVTVTKKKKNKTKHDLNLSPQRLSPRRIELATPIMERKRIDSDKNKKKKNGEQVGRRSGRARVPPGVVIESTGGRTPSLSDYVKQSFERRQNELKKFSSDEEADFYNFNYLMKKLVHGLGWKYGNHPLGGWIYYKPESRLINKGGKHMHDYFLTEKEVIEFCRENNYYDRRAELGLGSSSSSSSSSTSKRKRSPDFALCTP